MTNGDGSGGISSMPSRFLRNPSPLHTLNKIASLSRQL